VLLLGLKLARDIGVKVTKVIGVFDLIVMQVRNQFATKNKRLKKYTHAILDLIKLFHAFPIIIVPREENVQINALVVVATTLQPCQEIIQRKQKMEVVFRPSIPNNFEHSQVIHDDARVLRFLNNH
jgi:hypothetical protein